MKVLSILFPLKLFIKSICLKGILRIWVHITLHLEGGLTLGSILHPICIFQKLIWTQNLSAHFNSFPLHLVMDSSFLQVNSSMGSSSWGSPSSFSFFFFGGWIHPCAKYSTLLWLKKSTKYFHCSVTGIQFDGFDWTE